MIISQKKLTLTDCEILKGGYNFHFFVTVQKSFYFNSHVFFFMETKNYHNDVTLKKIGT